MPIWILAALLLRTCLVGSHAFFEPRHVVVDDRIVGVYADDQTGIVATISRTSARGRYRAVLQENGSRSLYAIFLFKAGQRTFADISAERAPVVRTPGERKAPATELLARATAGGRHLALRVAVRKGGMLVWMPMPNTLGALWQAEPKVRRLQSQDGVNVVSEPTRTLHRLLEKYGQDDRLFSQGFEIAKQR